MSVSVEGPPPVSGDEKASLLAGPGRGMPAGRGMGLGAGKSSSIWLYTESLAVDNRFDATQRLMLGFL